MTNLNRIAVFLLTSTVLIAQDSNTFTSKSLGISLTKPANWVWVTAQEHSEALRNTKLTGDLQKVLARVVPKSPILMTKYQEPYDGINPNFRADAFPMFGLDGSNPVSMIAGNSTFVPKVVKDYREIQAPKELNLGGFRAAYMKYFYTLETVDGKAYPASAELYVIPMGDYYWCFGIGSSQTSSLEEQEEIYSILKSVKIETPADFKQP